MSTSRPGTINEFPCTKSIIGQTDEGNPKAKPEGQSLAKLTAIHAIHTLASSPTFEDVVTSVGLLLSKQPNSTRRCDALSDTSDTETQPSRKFIFSGALQAHGLQGVDLLLGACQPQLPELKGPV